MRKRNLLLALFALVGLGANAQWVKPVPTLSPASALVVAEAGADKDAATAYYLWNEQTQSFLHEGNQWKCQATLDPAKGQKIFFETIAEGNYYMNTYLEENGNSQRPKWDLFWIRFYQNTETEYGHVYTDYTYENRGYSQENYPAWNFETSGDNVRIKVGSLMPEYGENPAAHYLGYPASSEEGSTVVTADCTTSDNVNWRVVTVEAYNEYVVKYPAWVASEKLRADMEECKDKNPGIDLSEIEAVYNNTNSTAEELEAARLLIPEIEKSFVTASVANPKDVTNFIKNPNYDEGSANWEGGLGTGDNVGSYWNAGTEPFDFYQTLTDLPNGVYQVQVHSAHRIGGSGNYGAHYKSGVLDPYKQYLKTCQVYANNFWKVDNDITSENIKENLGDAYWDREIVNGYYIPVGTSYVKGAYNDLNMFDNSLFCVVTDGILKIGVRCQDRMAGSWTSFDKWRLTYYGSGDDALELLKSELAESLADYEDEIVQASLKETYSAALKALENAADFAAAEAAYTEAIGLFYDIEKNRDAYNNYINLVAEVEPQTEGLNNEAADALIDYIGEDFEKIIEETPYSTEELEAEMQKVKDMLDAAIKNAIEVGKDFTNLIPNHDMKQASFQEAGWTITPADVNIKGNKDRVDKYDTQYHMGEAWQFQTFDMSYTLTGMPAGIYELEIPAVYRNRDHNYDNPAPVEIYVNDLSINIKTAKDDAISEADAISTEFEPGDDYMSPEEWEDANCYNINSLEGDTGWPNDQILEIDGQNYYIPGSCDGAAVAFYAGRYINKAYGVVGQDGVLKLGIRTKENTGLADQWVAIGHIKMTYMATDPVALNGVKEEVDAQANIYRDRTDSFYKGYIEELDAAVNSLLVCEDINDVVAASSAVQSVYNKIDESVALYKEINTLVSTSGTGLYEAAVRFMEAGMISEAEAETYLSEAEAYIEGCEEGTYSNEAAKAIIEKIKNEKIVDVIYIRGGLDEVLGDNWDTFDHPMLKTEDGKYVGVAKFRDERYGSMSFCEAAPEGTGAARRNYVIIALHYLDKDICAADNATRFLNNSTIARKAKVGANDKWFATWGGEWKFTFDMADSTLVAEPVGDFLYKDHFFAEGNLKGNGWQKNESTARNWELVRNGNLYQGSIAFNNGVDRGEITIFTSTAWDNGWGESRLGSVEDQLKLESGQEAACNIFEGDRKWILDPAEKYLVTYDLAAGTVRFDARALEGEGTEAAPYLIASYEDLLMMRSYMAGSEMTYFAQTADIDMKGLGWSQLNGAGCDYSRGINYDGRNHVITNFGGVRGYQAVDDPSFFGVLKGSVKNVGFVDANVQEADFMRNYERVYAANMAVVAGKANGATIENVFVTGTVSGANVAGALVATVEGTSTLKNVFAQADVTTDDNLTGGLVGYANAELTLQNAYLAGAENAVIGAVEEGVTLNAANIVNWTGSADATAQYNFNGSNHADLQKTVVAFDNTVWGCSMKEGDYPVLKAFGEVIPDAIQNVELNAEQQTIYDLTGRRVLKAQKGLYIINGKKALVK